MAINIGAARGCGWQKLCSFINLGAYYVVGIPSAVLFAFIFRIGGMVGFLFLSFSLTLKYILLVVEVAKTIFVGALDWHNMWTLCSSYGTYNSNCIY